MEEILTEYKYNFSKNKEFYLGKMIYEGASLKLVLSCGEKNQLVNIEFDWVHSVHLTDESDLFYYPEGMRVGIFIFNNSDYLKWFHKQSDNIYLHENVIHYLIVTSNEVIEVLSSVEPLQSEVMQK